MQVRSSFRHLMPGDQVNVSTIWDQGHAEMDMAYNAATARPITFTFELNVTEMVFFFVGGRSSLIQYFASRQNTRLFLPNKSSSLGLIIDRKSYMLKKDKTLVGVCNTNLRSQYQVQPIRSFIGRPGVLPLDADGAQLTSAQLATVLYSIFRNPQQERAQVTGALKTAGLWG